MQKIVTHLWFDNKAEEAVKFYTSIFKNSKTGSISHYGEAEAGVSGQPLGSVMSIAFQLEGQDFIALNGGPIFKFSPAISLLVNCETQDEIDTLWSKLTSEGGNEVECGWLTDKYGLSWQITPRIFSEMITSPDREKAARAMKAMLKMKKLNIAELTKAFNGP